MLPSCGHGENILPHHIDTSSSGPCRTCASPHSVVHTPDRKPHCLSPEPPAEMDDKTNMVTRKTNQGAAGRFANLHIKINVLLPWTDSTGADIFGSVSLRTPVPAISHGASCAHRQAQSCHHVCHTWQRITDPP